ncbi:MAG: MBL fold metallo-hydrolase [Acidobacteria bacterium]|nr:MBL fold metallo-hydrolase [Acidobacteriota bacterium]
MTRLTVPLWIAACATLAAQTPARVRDLKITVLSTMLADNRGLGEWGFAALVETGGRRILFDTGGRPETVLRNAEEMNIDLAGITDVILSHNHGDHTNGLVTLRRELSRRQPGSLAVAHVGKGIFVSRPSPRGEGNSMIRTGAEYRALGGRFVEYGKPAEIHPGIWLTGPVPRRHPERNWSGSGRLAGDGGEDNLPEDMSMVFDTGEGLVLLSGCGHAGIINTLEHAREAIRKAPIRAAIGGFHLFSASDEHLAWTAGKLKEFELGGFLGAHCTGIEAVYRIRQLTGLARRTAAVASVGGTYSLSGGLSPGSLGR